MNREASREEVEERVRRADSGDMLGHLERFPRYVMDAADMTEEVPVPSGCSGVVVAGMGGSGIVGELMRALCRDSLDVPVHAVHDYDLPRFVDEDWFFVSVSYSGNTEETLSAHREAVERGCGSMAVTSNGELSGETVDKVIRVPEGIPPRAALPYLFAPLVGLANNLGGDFDYSEAAELPEVREDAFRVARTLEGTVPLVYGYGAFETVAYRWKCQLNENAKVHAFSNGFPELNHNEVEGWGGDGFSCVLLRSGDRRMEERVDATLEVALPGDTFEQRFEPDLGGVMSAINLGDWVSLYLAGLRGVDPTPVSTIERVKELLA